MKEEQVRQIVREEINRILNINETAKKGDKVSTPHGPGTVLTDMGASVRVKLNGGAILKVSKSKAIVVN